MRPNYSRGRAQPNFNRPVRLPPALPLATGRSSLALDTGAEVMPNPTKSNNSLDRFAIEDFGTTGVPIALRRRARLLAAELGITPRQALDQLLADAASVTGKDEGRSIDASQGRASSHSEVRGKAKATGASQGRKKAVVPTATRRTPPIWQLQRDAAAVGRKWVKTNCTVCAAEAYVHVEWRSPLVMCKECQVKRQARLRTVSLRNSSSKARRRKRPRRWSPVSGGLPSLGRRR